MPPAAGMNRTLSSGSGRERARQSRQCAPRHPWLGLGSILLLTLSAFATLASCRQPGQLVTGYDEYSQTQTTSVTYVPLRMDVVVPHNPDGTPRQAALLSLVSQTPITVWQMGCPMMTCSWAYLNCHDVSIMVEGGEIEVQAIGYSNRVDSEAFSTDAVAIENIEVGIWLHDLWRIASAPTSYMRVCEDVFELHGDYQANYQALLATFGYDADHPPPVPASTQAPATPPANAE